MIPTPDGGDTEAEATLYDRMLEGEFGPLIPTASARARLQLSDEALRRFGDEAEGLLGGALPTGSSGGRMYPEELLVLMALARAHRESGRARSRRAALAALLTARGWVAAAPDEEPADPAPLGEMVADLRAVSWRLTEVAPQLGGVVEEHRDVLADLYAALNRMTLELPQVLPHLERIRQANNTVTASARDLRQRTDHLSALTAALDAWVAAHHRLATQSRSASWAALWPVAVVSGASSLVGAVIARLLGS
ncbi:hypothetical protein E7T09_01020 [Deinococcus sp. KSM4-11]|uniref:hypothetical protein n=1 Tax=Deinococcus sp. KSM4-11 TaxID=2568654 RepID=UPI0010A3B4B2|nr:hypothetical protein [Deinococcus sp. KSM4-11]THF87850.1 hypothetical protein E7T09_01020 [Deinococcus sp. KSM4-11]